MRTLEMCSGPVNTLGRELRTALFTALARAEADPEVRGVVLRGKGAGFSGGADIDEFDSHDALTEPSLDCTIAAAIEAMTTPVVAAVHGFALGGGLELALLCHYRVATRDAKLGLPEITLGFMPGAGGTQRLVRALPLERALKHLLIGDTFAAATAAGEPLIHEVVDEADLEAATHRAIDLAHTQSVLPRLRDVPVDAASAAITVSAAEQLLARKRLLPDAAAQILDAVRVGLTDFDAGIQAEFDSFYSLASTVTARALRYQFKALRAVRRRSKASHEVKTAAVIGAGTMGRGIAALLAEGGLDVTIVDTNPDVLAAAAEHARENARGAVNTAAEISALPAVDLVIEAVVENLDIKRQVFRELGAVLSADTILATNTSSMDIDDIAAATVRADRVLGLHFFSPVSRMQLVEVIAGSATATATLERCRALLLALGKTPVVVENGPSFVGNRVFDRYLQEAHMLHLEGVSVAEVDAAAVAIGMPAGPLRVLDSIGIEVPHQARVQRGTAEDPEWEVARALVTAGRFGRKTGSGWYSYDGQGPQRDCSFADALADGARSELGIATRTFTPLQVQERLLMALIAEARAVVAAGTARVPSDVDVIMTLGYGIPAERGGPIFLADQMGEELVEAALARLAAQPGAFSGDRWMKNRGASAEESTR